jgi:hypothetical protein
MAIRALGGACAKTNLSKKNHFSQASLKISLIFAGFFPLIDATFPTGQRASARRYYPATENSCYQFQAPAGFLSQVQSAHDLGGNK